MVHVTLLFLLRGDEIMLAVKKRGFGEGKLNGVGGKLEPGETSEQAAIRECREEAGVTPRNLHKVCEIDFHLTNVPTFNHYAHVYTATEWKGEPHETEEMKPDWFPLNDIPYDNMWGDDKLWLPMVLAGKRFKASITLDAAENIIESHITETEGFAA